MSLVRSAAVAAPLALLLLLCSVRPSSSEKSDEGQDSPSCQSRFPFDRRDCSRPGMTCCPGAGGQEVQCGTIARSGLPKGKELKNPVCCLPVGASCAKNKRYDQCCHPLECQEDGSGKKKCLIAGGTEAPAEEDVAASESPSADDDSDD